MINNKFLYNTLIQGGRYEKYEKRIYVGRIVNRYGYCKRFGGGRGAEI